MLHGKGLPKEAGVKATLSWPAWQINGEFSYELFRSFSSMFSGKGLPKKADVKAVLSWPCWQVNGLFNLQLFRSFAAMFNGKGLPNEEYVMAFLSWLAGTDDLDMETLEQISTLFSSVFATSGTSRIPNTDRLAVYENQLLQLFPPDIQEDNHCGLQCKQLAFYAVSKKGDGSLMMHMFERFLKGYAGYFHPRCDVVAGLKLTKKSLANLHNLLYTSGSQGVRSFLAAADKKGWEMSRQECDQLCKALL